MCLTSTEKEKEFIMQHSISEMKGKDIKHRKSKKKTVTGRKVCCTHKHCIHKPA